VGLIAFGGRSRSLSIADGGNLRSADGVGAVVASRPRTESDLVEASRRGDAAAYAELVRAHQEIAFRTAYLITRNAADAEDAAQDGFVKAYYALPRFRRGAPLRPWLLRIVANEARNRRRSEGRREALLLRAAAQAPSGGAAPSPEGEAVAAEERARLLEALETLPEEQRLTVGCRYLLGLSEEETAAALRVRRGTVKSRLARALERLRELEARV
jgi:RNA polymerase sigma factor (sigma-70 family)